ncbi:MAG: hypothetical protein IPL55_22015 [Saprospiraceae bacterium]|jgi:hypothetical protein|nr:hypothetical protein [Saprospiraceae bacterium]MBL0025050.1 hypothetical protein [Saprospiraceae bacterium]
MIFITESTIEKYISQYEILENYLRDIKFLLSEHPDLMAFIDEENNNLLTKDEIALLEYLTVVIYFSSKDQYRHQLKISGSEIEKSEEANWETFNNAASKSFTKILDIYFTSYPQEDLLALVEDALQPDEDNPVTIVGREIIFVSCKSIIDSLHIMNL